jgi:Right handed beta helix region/CotH kinase protein
MKIKQEANDHRLDALVQRTISKSKKTTLWISGIVALGLATVLFFATLGYGAHLKKIGKATYYNNILLSIARLDFSFLKNFASSTTAGIEHFQIDLKFKHLQRIQFLREEALKHKYIPAEFKDESFPATLTIDGEPYDVDLSIAGLMTSHVVDPDKWSFEVKVKGEKTIYGLKVFGMLLPNSRGFMTDWLAFEVMKERGLIGLRTDFVRVSINGKDTGIFYLEERFDKQLIEGSKLREGIIFKLDEGFKAYKEKQILKTENMRDQYLMAKRMWQEVVAGDLPAEQFFDMKKMGTVFASTDLFNNMHPLYPGNLRFYFNPVTGLAEPIAREYGSLHNYDLSTMAMFLETPRPENYRHNKLRNDPVLKIIYNNEEFQRNYIRENEILSSELFLDSLFAKKGQKIEAVVKKVYADWPFYQLPSEKLYENAQYIRDHLHPATDYISAYYAEKKDSTVIVHIRNNQDLPVEVSYLTWKNKVILQPAKNTIIPARGKTAPNQVNLYNFTMPKGFDVDSMLSQLTIHYNMMGSAANKRNSLVFPWSYEERLDRGRNPIVKPVNYKSFSFIKETDKALTIPAGTWQVNEDLIIPEGKIFAFEPGATLDLINKAKIICNTTVRSIGTEEHPVTIMSSDSSSRGFIILRAPERSRLEHTNMKYLNNPKDYGYGIPGAVTFFESPVDIVHTTFESNIQGDDFLNIVRTNFTMDQTTFKNIGADAFDCDFCLGEVANSKFINIGNDGIDVSGTKITIRDVYMELVHDKAFSCGEDSDMKLFNCEIINSSLALTAKDKSHIEAENVTIQKCDVGVSAYQKKPEFGPATVNLKNCKITDLSHAEPYFYLVEPGSVVITDGVRIDTLNPKTIDLLYGNKYGEASKRTK